MNKSIDIEKLSEQNFPCIREEQEERNLCLKYLMMTEEFINTNIIKCSFHKTNGEYILNGMGFIDYDNSETINFNFSTEVTYENDSIEIISNISKIYIKDNQILKTEEKQTYDKFFNKQNKLIKETYYIKNDKTSIIEYPNLDDFNRFYELAKLNSQSEKQR